MRTFPPLAGSNESQGPRQTNPSTVASFGRTEEWKRGEREQIQSCHTVVIQDPFGSLGKMSLSSNYELHTLHQIGREQAAFQLCSANGPTEFNFETAKRSEEEPQIPSESIFNSLSNEPFIGVYDGAPSVAQCAAHLELLEAFVVLRKRVINSNALDVAFGIWQKRGNDPSLSQRRQTKWTKFVQIAVMRFRIWFLIWGPYGIARDAIGVQASQLLPPLGLSNSPSCLFTTSQIQLFGG